MANPRLPPGKKAPASGQYKPLGPRGGDSHREITAVKGKTLPPAPAAGVTYKLVDRTKNKAGQG